MFSRRYSTEVERIFLWASASPCMKMKHTGTHVCRRWRRYSSRIASSRRLDLENFSARMEGTPLRKDLGSYWLTHPIIVNNFVVATTLLETARAMPHSSTPILSRARYWERCPLSIFGADTVTRHRTRKAGDMPDLPGEFLGGSAPCLRDIR